MTQPLTVISYGGGVQSTALLVLAATGVLKERLGLTIDAALFSNVGDDSEHPNTLRYVREVARPFCERSNLTLHELSRITRDGQHRTLYGDLMGSRRSIDIPVRMENGAPGNRNCTQTYKIAVIGKWLKANGASPENKANVAIGISTDEIHRVNRKRAQDYENPLYPLIELNLDRAACQKIIADARLPVPPKSACWFCPFHRPQAWSERRRDEPELFWRAADLERTLRERSVALGRNPVYLTGLGRPIEDAIPEAQDTLPGMGSNADFDTCDEGYCWT